LNLHLRLYANCEDDAEARQLSGKIAWVLSEWDPSPRIQPRQYWKMAELYEFAFSLHPATLESFQTICALAVGSWFHVEQTEERSSIWNRADDARFLTPEVSWAELQLYESAP